MRTCSKCGENKALSEYPKNGYSPYGQQRYRAQCLACERLRETGKTSAEMMREWRAKNPEHVQMMKTRRRLKASGIEVEPLPQRIPKFKGPQHYREYQLANRAHLLKKSKEWKSRNADKLRAKKARRRAAELNATPAWADLEAIYFFYKEALKKTRNTGEIWEVDHIVPLQGKNVCGFHVENNLQVILRAENRAKWNKLLPDIAMQAAA